jgi:hypothetical protein
VYPLRLEASFAKLVIKNLALNSVFHPRCAGKSIIFPGLLRASGGMAGFRASSNVIILLKYAVFLSTQKIKSWAKM